MSLSLADKTKIKKVANNYCYDLLKSFWYYIRLFNERGLPVTVERLLTFCDNMKNASDSELCTYEHTTQDGKTFKLLVTPYVAEAMIKFAGELKVQTLDLQTVNNNTDVFYKVFYPDCLNKAFQGYIFKKDVKIIQGGGEKK